MLPVDLEGTIDILLRPCVVFPLSAFGIIVSGTPNSTACWMARFKRYMNCGISVGLSNKTLYLLLQVYIQNHSLRKLMWIPKVLLLVYILQFPNKCYQIPYKINLISKIIP